MTREQIVDRLRQMMKQSSRQETDWDRVGEDTTIESLGFDSLSILDLIYDVQQEFGLEFDAEELASVKSVGDLAAFLGKKIAP